MNRNINTTLYNILSLISCAYDYGFEKEVLFVSFSEMLENKLSTQEIINYLYYLNEKENLSSEDLIIIKERIINFKNKYIDE